jgi:hypothetical protein
MKKSLFTAFVLMLTLTFGLTQTGCRKKRGEPLSRICLDKLTYFKGDTVRLQNCSENFTTQRWSLPDGTVSNAKDIVYVPPTFGTYKFTLYVNNDDFIYDYESYVFIEVK